MQEKAYVMKKEEVIVALVHTPDFNSNPFLHSLQRPVDSIISDL